MTPIESGRRLLCKTRGECTCKMYGAYCQSEPSFEEKTTNLNYWLPSNRRKPGIVTKWKDKRRNKTGDFEEEEGNSIQQDQV